MVKRLLHRLLAPINPTGIVLLGIYTLLWGFWLANPWWDVFSKAELYSKMNDLAPEVVWGSVAIASSLAILYGAIKPSYRNLIVGSAVGAWHWSMLSILYLLGDWRNTGGITSMFIALYSFYIWVNIKANGCEYQFDTTDDSW